MSKFSSTMVSFVLKHIFEIDLKIVFPVFLAHQVFDQPSFLILILILIFCLYVWPIKSLRNMDLALGLSGGGRGGRRGEFTFCWVSPLIHENCKILYYITHFCYHHHCFCCYYYDNLMCWRKNKVAISAKKLSGKASLIINLCKNSLVSFVNVECRFS